MKTCMLVAGLALTAAMSLTTSTSVHADPGGRCHFHGSKPASEATVQDCAAQRKDTLIKSGKLDASWKAISAEKIEAVDGKKGKEWKVSYRNPAVTDKSKETLYMFFTLPGNFIAANFSGK
ncbi:MAG: DUF6488 family protein [Burkholderiales bacterium]|nr:DUF6488 family protein [Burkholderiales bacterium]